MRCARGTVLVESPGSVVVESRERTLVWSASALLCTLPLDRELCLDAVTTHLIVARAPTRRVEQRRRDKARTGEDVVKVEEEEPLSLLTSLTCTTTRLTACRTTPIQTVRYRHISRRGTTARLQRARTSFECTEDLRTTSLNSSNRGPLAQEDTAGSSTDAQTSTGATLTTADARGGIAEEAAMEVVVDARGARVQRGIETAMTRGTGGTMGTMVVGAGMEDEEGCRVSAFPLARQTTV